MVDPATLPEMVPSPGKKEVGEGERRIDLSEIIGLPDFDVSQGVADRPSNDSQAARPGFLSRWKVLSLV
jgi:hypothetical protein